MSRERDWAKCAAVSKSQSGIVSLGVCMRFVIRPSHDDTIHFAFMSTVLDGAFLRATLAMPRRSSYDAAGNWQCTIYKGNICESETLTLLLRL